MCPVRWSIWTASHLNTFVTHCRGLRLAHGPPRAKSTESSPQVFPPPIGFKNGTGGSTDLAIHAVQSASQPQRFFGCNQHGQITAIETSGNPHCHIILRGSTRGPNYSPVYVQETKHKLLAQDLPPNIVIDMSHGNSQKQHKNQRVVCASVADQIACGSRCIKGVMIESNLVEGKQCIDNTPLVFGQSVTDACVGLDDTEIMLAQLARAQASLSTPAQTASRPLG